VRLISIICLSAFLFLPTKAWAWGEYGHVTICEIAYRELTPTARQKVNHLISVHPYHSSFNRSCMFADDGPERSLDPTGKRDKQRSKAHFINVPRHYDHIGTSDCVIGPDCTFKAISDEMDILTNSEASETDQALAMVLIGHWIGDLHQPLHVSFSDDLGGNNIKTTGTTCRGYYNRRTRKRETPSLHSVWDSCIINNGIFEYSWIQNLLGWAKHTKSYRAADRLRAEITDAERSLWRSRDMIVWADESYKYVISESVGYCVIDEGVCEKPDDALIVDKAYIDTHTPIVKERMKMASVRLAHKLNTALDPDYIP